MFSKWLCGPGAVVCAVALLVAASSEAMGEEKEEKKAASTRVYELRTYYCLPGRLEALHKRFREHTVKLFEKHGIKNEMYWTPTDERKNSVLIYVVSHDSAEAAKKSWDAFRADPEWKKVAAESEKDGKIIEKVEAVYMTLADFSPGPK